MNRPKHHRPPRARANMRGFKSLSDFYPFYKQQHRKLGTRVLHFLGTTAFLLLCATAAGTRQPLLGVVGVVTAYLLAWVGHFFVEHNKPATFKYPLWSLASDFIMYFNILRRREPFQLE